MTFQTSGTEGARTLRKVSASWLVAIVDVRGGECPRGHQQKEHSAGNEGMASRRAGDEEDHVMRGRGEVGVDSWVSEPRAGCYIKKQLTFRKLTLTSGRTRAEGRKWPIHGAPGVVLWATTACCSDPELAACFTPFPSKMEVISLLIP